MLLSICIPSYNRFENLSRIIKALKKCKSQDFEVVIVDNCSPKNIENIIPKDDSRFRIIRREKAVKGTVNGLHTLNSGRGDFCMLILDKDFIDGAVLNAFLETLKKNYDVACGACALNFTEKRTSILIKNQEENLKEMYIMQHPSGRFVKNIYIQEALKITELSDMESANGFELIFATALVNGKCMYFNDPMVFTETEDEAAKTPSYTYNNMNIWFHPSKQIEAFDRYCRHLNKLKLLRKSRDEVIKYMLERLMVSCTLTYRDIMQNQKLCRHYMMEPTKITAEELKKWKKETEDHFLKSTIVALSISEKKKMVRIASIYYRVRCIKSFLKSKILKAKGKP